MDTANAPEYIRASKLKQVSLIFACGTALFSDGYANGVIGSVNTLLNEIYPAQFKKHHTYSRTLSSLTFAGTLVGMLTFGYMSDKIGRKSGMMIATAIVALFSGLSATAYGANDSFSGLIASLSAYRFLLGIGVGAEYPCGSVAASEQTEGPAIAKNAQHRWFALATNTMIDWGFVIAAFVPLVLLWIFGLDHLRAVWRISLGLGVIPAVLVFFWRLKMMEPELVHKNSMKHCSIPYWLVIKRYWVRLAAISVTWFIYDFITYPFGIYSSTIVNSIIGDTSSLYVTFGWNVVINLFYIPGAVAGAFIIDYLGPKNTMTGPTAIRGHFYGVAAAVGKVGAFVGTWAFPPMIAAFSKHGTDPRRGETGPFWVGSGLAILSALITILFIKPLTHDGMEREDADFRAYLEANSYDTSQMGLTPSERDVEIQSREPSELDEKRDIAVEKV